MTSDFGIIGLGVIGYGMASNLRKKLPPSSTFHVYDINDAALQRFADEFGSYGKIEIAKSPKELASRCKTIISSLPGGLQVRQVYLDAENGVIAATKDPDRLFIECSTIEIESTQEIGETIQKAGLGRFVDAPVSGGVWGAKAGTLSFMVGHAKPSEEEDVVGKLVLETLSYIGTPETIEFCGGLGMGQVAKIAHNYVSLCNNVVATQGMALGLKYGIDKHVLWKVMTDGTADSWVMGLEQPVPGLVADAPSSNGYKRAFAARLSLKDLVIAVNAAKRVGLNPTVGEVAIEQFQKVHDDPRTTDLDHTSLWLHVTNTVEEFLKEQNAEEKK